MSSGDIRQAVADAIYRAMAPYIHPDTGPPGEWSRRNALMARANAARERQDVEALQAIYAEVTGTVTRTAPPPPPQREEPKRAQQQSGPRTRQSAGASPPPPKPRMPWPEQFPERGWWEGGIPKDEERRRYYYAWAVIGKKLFDLGEAPQMGLEFLRHWREESRKALLAHHPPTPMVVFFDEYFDSLMEQLPTMNTNYIQIWEAQEILKKTRSGPLLLEAPVAEVNSHHGYRPSPI